MGKRYRNRNKKAKPGSAGQAHDNSAAAADTAALPPDSPPGVSSPAESNPYAEDASGPGLETPDDVRKAGLSPELPFEAPGTDDADIMYSDGKSFFERFPHLLKSSNSR